jgi:hypothetical protein
LAHSKTSKPLPSSNKKSQTVSAKPVISGSEYPHPEQQKAIDRLVSGVDNIPNVHMRDMSPAHRKLIQAMIPDTEGEGINFHLQSKQDREAITRDVLSMIASYWWDDCPQPGEKECERGPDMIGNHFAWGSSQVNTDLALAAQCEAEEDIYPEDETFFNLLRSPMYRDLAQTFIADGERGDSSALLKVVWRSYKAGLASPDRLIPDTKQVRMARWRARNEAEASSRAAKAGREALASADALLEKLRKEETGKD